MIKYLVGDLFKSNADALAHGCNTKGKMNAGIAKRFKEKFPEMYDDYIKRCKNNSFSPGSGYLFKNPEKPHVINLATQDNGPALFDFVDSALKWLADSYKDLEIYYVAMPKIGSGLGGLEWDLVNDLLKKHFDSSDLLIEVYSKD